MYHCSCCEHNHEVIEALQAELAELRKQQLAPRPWSVKESSIFDYRNRFIFNVNIATGTITQQRDNLVAQHIVECVNAADKKEGQ